MNKRNYLFIVKILTRQNVQQGKLKFVYVCVVRFRLAEDGFGIKAYLARLAKIGYGIVNIIII